MIIFLTYVLKNYFGPSEFESADMKAYDFVFVDPWTWAAKGDFACLEENLMIIII